MEHFFSEEEKEKVKKYEKHLIYISNEVWFVGEKLKDIYLSKYSEVLISKKVKIVPNGINSQIFANVRSQVKFKTKGKINIGFVGALAGWVDIDLMKKILGIENCVLNIAGPDFVGVLRELRKYKNLKYYGTIDKKDVPNFINDQDICLLPFRLDNPLSIASEPLKLIEYFYLQKPVISTSIPAINKVRHLVYVLESPNNDDIESIIKKAYYEDEKFKVLRYNFAKEYIWEKIALKALIDV
ncbi:hypothetical protein ciss_21480 [Carboxydothermus islandicus]|uniref:Glycosyl transferase family 1 domain-containing protein n=1 Tax=Carboxydothermus islandicus TaxID=661089 RepID=A0A1L8D4V8_9THEO|nr:glycosyltransferase [Carboxydothermus islandicus]GAV26215.1 hypothetical protein ciss_21480 [Carboxydothermus islandicus]